MKPLVLAVCVLAITTAAALWLARRDAPAAPALAETVRSNPEPAAAPMALETRAVDVPGSELSAPPEREGSERAAPTPDLPERKAAAPKPPASGPALTKEEARWKQEYGEASPEELRSLAGKFGGVADEERERLWAEPELARQAFETLADVDVSLLEVERRNASPGKTAVARRVEPHDKYGPARFQVIQVPSDQAEVLSELQRRIAWLQAQAAVRKDG